MSSTQLIEQCATRLRGIVEALDNIHDTSPHRWSTDLDDVHSSAESLLAMINDQASNQADLAQPSPKCTTCGGAGMVVAQHERISAQLHDALDECDGDRWKLRSERDAANERADTLEHRMMGMMTRHFAEAWRNRDTQKALDGYLSAGIAQLEQERDAALANVDALAVQVLKLGGTISFDYHPVAQAGQVPQAWLDVQAERKRQVEVEGWTPEHDDEHNGGELADAAACYALSAAGWSTYAARERWPWPLEWWKPSTARRDLVKACALALAEIERLDRAAASQGGPSDA
ncbi:hypothetical protein ACV4WP_21200 [Pseudomonas aeruginosa]|uniref:hypothetical protein n=1 Tax=Pseudomonas aeruginosa TaxID=287 RepID=UPI00178400F0|nr:hypothetical protein [Pseudomonas aeruginosa]